MPFVYRGYVQLTFAQLLPNREWILLSERAYKRELWIFWSNGAEYVTNPSILAVLHYPHIIPFATSDCTGHCTMGRWNLHYSLHLACIPLIFLGLLYKLLFTLISAYSSLVSILFFSLVSMALTWAESCIKVSYTTCIVAAVFVPSHSSLRALLSNQLYMPKIVYSVLQLMLSRLSGAAW